MKSRVLNFYMACCLSLMHAILISLYDCSEEEGRTRTKVVPSPTVSIRIQRLVGGCYSVALKFVFPLLWCAFIHWWSSLVHSVICLRISVIQRKGDQICHHNQKFMKPWPTSWMGGDHTRGQIFIFPRVAAKGCSGEVTQHPHWNLFLKATALVWVWTLNLKAVELKSEWFAYKQWSTNYCYSSWGFCILCLHLFYPELKGKPSSSTYSCTLPWPPFHCV